MGGIKQEHGDGSQPPKASHSADQRPEEVCAAALHTGFPLLKKKPACHMTDSLNIIFGISYYYSCRVKTKKERKGIVCHNLILPYESRALQVYFQSSGRSKGFGQLF